MARQSYSETDNIHSMNTRQLRQYIADQSAEAEKRIATSDLDDTSRAFRDAMQDITYANGRVIKSTSNLNKTEMRELAYNYRQFNSLDTTSGFAQSIEWKENKSRYESFIKNQSQGKSEYSDYWKQFILPSGNISKKGYKAYKEYIEFVKTLGEKEKEEFGYRDIKQYGIDAVKSSDSKRTKIVSNILNQVYFDAKGKGLTTSEMIDKFKKELEAYDEKEAKKTVKKATRKPSGSKKKTSAKKHSVKKSTKIPTVKTSSKKSQTNVKVKSTGKMKTNATIRERLT